jgi:hypothetical protein
MNNRHSAWSANHALAQTHVGASDGTRAMMTFVEPTRRRICLLGRNRSPRLPDKKCTDVRCHVVMRQVSFICRPEWRLGTRTVLRAAAVWVKNIFCSRGSFDWPPFTACKSSCQLTVFDWPPTSAIDRVSPGFCSGTSAHCFGGSDCRQFYRESSNLAKVQL